MVVLGVVAVTFAIALVFGAAVGRWFAVVVAACAWPALVLLRWGGERLGVWGDVSEQTPAWFVLLTLVFYSLAAVAGAAAGVLARRGVHRRAAAE
ncbi:MAG: hypothetical protein ICV64_09685 [Thermoleophilia bacterium]|nr:hypothetical protein [Thermoleophilia bacterium]